MHKNASFLFPVLVGIVTLSSTASAATFSLQYADEANSGFNDPAPWTPVGGNPGRTLGEARRNALDYATRLLGRHLVSSVPIVVQARFANLGCPSGSVALARAAPSCTKHSFTTSLPYTQTVPSKRLYPAALADAIHGSDLPCNEADDDIWIEFNSVIGSDDCRNGRPFYYGFDRQGTDLSFDFVTIAIHELLHGLGFMTFMDFSTGKKGGGKDDIYMRFLERLGASPSLLPSMTDQQRLGALTSDPDLVWSGTAVSAEAVRQNRTDGVSAGKVRIHAPSPIPDASSIAHFTSDLNPDDLMEPRYARPMHGSCLAMRLLEDLGWKVEYPDQDLYIRDEDLDVGTEPQAPGGKYFKSPDIYVGTDPQGLDRQAGSALPISFLGDGLHTRIRVRVHNRGCRPASGTLHLYWSAKTSNHEWPKHWVGWTEPSQCGSVVLGNKILAPSPLVITDLAPGESTDFFVPWTLPDPDALSCWIGFSQRYAILARIETTPAAPYGMASAETTDTYANVRNNNNIAMRTLWLRSDHLTALGYSPVGVRFKDSIPCLFPCPPRPRRIDFEISPVSGIGPIDEWLRAEVVLPPAIFHAWDLGGRTGSGVEWIAGTTLRLLSDSASIDNLALDHEETYEIEVRAVPLRPIDGSTSRVVDIDISYRQPDDSGWAVLGGQSVRIDLNQIELVAPGSQWRHATGNDLGSNWRAPGFDDSSWSQGSAPLGYGHGAEATIVDGGPDSARNPTVYFRARFDLDSVDGIDRLSFRTRRSDGIIAYLNGVEVLRSNMPAGPVFYETPASGIDPEGGNRLHTVTLDASHLVPGANTVAVEVHVAGSDAERMFFDLGLSANAPNSLPRISIAEPMDGGVLYETQVLLRSSSEDPDGEIVRVEYFAGFEKVGESTVPPFDSVWQNAPRGEFCLTAAAFDRLGARTDSAAILVNLVGVPVPLTISVSGETAEVAWVESGQPQPLSSASEPTGPYSEIGIVPSPYRATIGAQARFFRLGNAESTHPRGIVGYSKSTLPIGYSLITYPFDLGQNRFSDLLPRVPDGVSIFKYRPGSGFSANTFFDGWDRPGETLVPGEGFFLHNPGPGSIEIVFHGHVRADFQSITLPTGFSLVGLPVPKGGRIGELGLPGADGDIVFPWDRNRYSVGTYFGDWDNPDLRIPRGNAFFYYNPGAPKSWPNPFRIVR